MRMRRKKNLDKRFECNDLVVLQKSTDIYRLPEEDRYDVQNLEQLFNNTNPVELEIGCGKGTFITTKAKLNPNINYIGVEIIDNVIISAAETAMAEKLENVRFFNCGAEILQYLLPKNSIFKFLTSSNVFNISILLKKSLFIFFIFSILY